jgi:hypothetical protein
MDTIIKLNDQLMGAPAGVLVIFLSIALGYLLKGIRVFENRFIPLAVVIASTVLFMLLSPTRAVDTPLRIWLTRNFIIGFILGFVAWALHKLVLQHIEDNIPGLNQWIAQDDKGGPPPTPSQPTTP